MKQCPYCRKEIKGVYESVSPVQYDDKGRLCHSDCWNREVTRREQNGEPLPQRVRP